ncbi:nickel-responsive transcriptional regulator NikR [Campylobacter mucosalis]|uniref:nickel-responsive transcriptional regulator NikR n=1 Tax=Campylobacter mucosalis TaxID=202 RepID=UPI00147028A9|nr:nickel-responsive transcriptional regulator NikR [Campylobacter mucosalis]
MDDIIRFSVSLPKSLLDELDKKILEQGYASRSELTRDLIREKMVKDSWSHQDVELIGVLTIIYTHHQSDLVVKMLELEHDANIDIICTTHVHIDHHNCLETLVLRGKTERIKTFSERIGGLKGVKFCELTRAAVPHS